MTRTRPLALAVCSVLLATGPVAAAAELQARARRASSAPTETEASSEGGTRSGAARPARTPSQANRNRASASPTAKSAAKQGDARASKAKARKKSRPRPGRKAHDPHVVFPADADVAPAVQYAGLDEQACARELAERNVSYVAAEPSRGVLYPVRLTGPVRGIAVHGEERESKRPTSPYEIFDCRLVLAVDDLAQMLAPRGVVAIVHLSVYRPPPRGFAEGRAGTRHDGALAIDVARFEKADGSVLDVDRHFNGRIGTETCGPGTGPNPATPEATELRTLFCDAAEARYFNVMLSPDYDRKHKNHFHLEVAANVKWFLVH
jgi:hypothetical protein